MITYGEKLYAWRRRHRLTQTATAKRLKVYWRRIVEWERDDYSVLMMPKNLMKLLDDMKPLEKWEMLGLWRRRRGWEIKDAARIMGISHVTLIGRERGEGNWERSYAWWTEESHDNVA